MQRQPRPDTLPAMLRQIRAPLLAAVAALAASCTAPPPHTRLAFVSVYGDGVSADVLATGIRGEWCFSENALAVSVRPPWRARLADHGQAVRRALASVPDANVLLNASLDVRVEQYLLFQRICAIATGDAGRIE